MVLFVKKDRPWGSCSFRGQSIRPQRALDIGGASGWSSSGLAVPALEIRRQSTPDRWSWRASETGTRRDVVAIMIKEEGQREDRNPDLVIMAGDSCCKGCGFESEHRTLDGHFFTFICCKKWNVCLKKTKINLKRPGMTHLKNVATKSLYLEWLHCP